MTTFGDPNTFAIQCERIAVESGWCLGRFRLWVGGHSFGDFDDTIDLGASRSWTQVFLDAEQQRVRPDLYVAKAREVFSELYGKYVGDRVGEWNGSWDRDPYVLDEVGDASLRDRCSIVVVRSLAGNERIIVREISSNALHDYLVPHGCSEVLRQYLGWISDVCC